MTKHIAIFLPSLDGGGAEKVALTLSRLFSKKGHRCDVLIAINRGSLLSCVPDEIRLVNFNKMKTSHASVSLARYLIKERPSVLLATVFTANLTASLAYILSGMKTRLVLCEASLPEFDVIAPSRIQTVINKLSARLLYKFAHASIAISKDVKQNLMKQKLVSPHRIHVIPNPVDPALFIRPPSAAERKQELVACGRLEAQKDYPTLIRAFAELRKKIDVRLVILGEGTLQNSLEELANDLGVIQHIHFAGFVAHPEDYMRRAAVFIHTARYEGFGIVFLEALASGCPVVATDCPGGVRDVLEDGRYGALVPVGDPIAISETVLSILRGERTFPSALNHLKSFDQDTICARYLDVLLPEHHR